MDSQISLALIAKAKLVFERDDTFLAFPITPLAYDRQQLNFVSNDAGQNTARLMEFSHLVDRIPEGMTWGLSGDHTLSGIYREVLRDAQLASSTRTAAEEAAYDKAQKFLFIEDADGLRRDTPVYVAYQRFRDAYIRALEDFKNAQLTAENSSDAAVKQRWTAVDEPLLRSKLDAADDEWRNQGQKAAVEQAKNVISSLGAKNASLTWAQWQSHCNPDLDFQTDPATNQTFAPAAFSPANALDQGSWQTFTLAGPEVDALAKQAPAEIRSRLGNVVDLDVDSVSFEYSSAGLLRSWLTSDAFRARFWRFGDPSRLLSDGATPAHGLCPAYIAGVIFARNLNVKLKTDSVKNDKVVKRIGAGEQIRVASFGVARADRLTATNNMTIEPAAFNRSAVMSSATKANFAQPARVESAPRKPIASAATVAAPHRAMGVTATARPATVVATPVMAKARPEMATVRPEMVAVRPARSMVVLQNNNFQREPVVSAAPGRPAVSKPPDADDNHILILGFICKRLPRCPDPDPALRW